MEINGFRIFADDASPQIFIINFTRISYVCFMGGGRIIICYGLFLQGCILIQLIIGEIQWMGCVVG
jgi:hypothetical protein